MPASLELQREYGSDLQVMFVEVQGADAATAEAFAWRQKWMGTEAMWTTERPLTVEGNTIPKFALLDAEGKLLISGNPLEKKKAIEETIADQVKKARNPPAGTPAKLAKPWATFVKGDVAGALAACDAAGAGDPALAEGAKALREEMVARTESKLARGKWLLDNGYVAEGNELLAGMAKSVKGDADLAGKVAAEQARVTAPDAAMAAEAAASKDLATLQQKMVKDKPFEDGNVKALTKLAEKHKGTKAAERAARLAQLAKLDS